MGNTSTTGKSTSSSTATPQEQQLLNNEMQISNANTGNQINMNQHYADLINAILTGQNLPGQLQGAYGIGQDQTQQMVNASLRDIAPQFQTSGILNSGEAAQIAGRTAMDTRNANAQFNVQAIQNLLNAGTGGASSWTAANNQNNATTGSQLAGLRTNTSSSSQTQNPFLNSFYSSLGSSFAKIPTAAMSAIPGGGAFSSAIGK